MFAALKRAALYVRVSSQGQVRDGYSLQFQEDILKEFCAHEGLLVTGVYRDGGQSGSTTKRKDLLRLIEDARQKRFDVVLIFRVDRFSRDPVDLLALVRELEVQNIKLRSVTEAVDASDPAGELMLTILGAIGKFVRQNIIQNAMLGKNKRAEGGKYTGGKVPFGYVVDEAGMYQPDSQPWWNGRSAAEVVKLVFDTYVKLAGTEGGGCLQLADRLNSMGIPAPNKVWSRSTVYQMLRNPAYAGDFAYNKRSHQLNKASKLHDREEWLVVKDTHTPLVDRHTWDRVQAYLKGNRKGAGRPVDRDSRDLVAGYVRCGECGGALTPRRPTKNQPHTYYTCASRYSEKRSRDGSACKSFPWFRAEELEQLVWGALLETAGSEERINQIRERMSANAGPDLAEAEGEVRRLDKRCQALEQQAMTLTTAYAEGKLPDYLWQKQLERVEVERKAIQDRLTEAKQKLAELKAQAPTMTTTEIRAYLLDVLTNRTTLDERREALGILIGPRGIKVYKDGVVDFDIKIQTNAASRSSTAELLVPSRQAL